MGADGTSFTAIHDSVPEITRLQQAITLASREVGHAWPLLRKTGGKRRRAACATGGSMNDHVQHRRQPSAPAPLFPRLNLPKFQLTPRTAGSALEAPLAHARAHAPARLYQSAPALHQPQPAAPYVPRRDVHAAPVAYQPAAVPVSESWFTPLHLGILATLLVVALMMSQTPGSAMRTAPSKLPVPAGLTKVRGGGGSATLPMTRPAVGMPSPAAAASIAAERGEPVTTGSSEPIQFKGIPSPAAAATMAPQTLPMRRPRAFSLPYGSGERDSHAVDSYYGRNSVSGGGGTEDLPTRPAVTPAEAAEQARLLATQQRLSDAGSAPAEPNGTF